MVHYEDLSSCSELPRVESRAVGWLELEHDYAKGPVSDEFLEAFTGLLSFHWAPFTACGMHECGLCVSDPVEDKDELIVPGEHGFLSART